MLNPYISICIDCIFHTQCGYTIESMMDGVFYGVSCCGCAFFYGYIHGDGSLYTKHSKQYECMTMTTTTTATAATTVAVTAAMVASLRNCVLWQTCICLSTGCIKHTIHTIFLPVYIHFYQVNAIFMYFCIIISRLRKTFH